MPTLLAARFFCGMALTCLTAGALRSSKKSVGANGQVGDSAIVLRGLEHVGNHVSLPLRELLYLLDAIDITE